MVFRCQKCHSPIALDKSITNLSKAQVKLLLSKNNKHSPNPEIPFISSDRIELYNNSKASSAKPVVSQDFSTYKEASSDSENSFIYISDAPDKSSDKASSDEGENAHKNVDLDSQLPDFSKIRTVNQVFQILSENQDISHPVCSECSDLLTDNYKLKFDQSQREREFFLSFLRKLKRQGGEDDGKLVQDREKCTEEYDAAKRDEESKLAELQSQETQYAELEQELRQLRVQYQELKASPLKEIYELKNALNLELSSKQSKLDQAKAVYSKHVTHLDQLRQLNMYSKLFDISFDGMYGRINGFRLGYKVPWPENNVALGQVVHMLKFIMERLAIEVPHYHLVPMGSQSYIVNSSDNGAKQKPALPLYSSNEFTLGKLFNFNKLDVSMLALLSIISQVETVLVQRDSELGLPYAVDTRHGTIGSKSIRATSNSQWTESCRYLLVNLNWILSYASAQQPA